MKKRARLDQVLLRLGYATQDDIRRALARQESLGGRLGSHLVALGTLSELQLVEALAQQFDLPWLPVVDREVDPTLIHRLPGGMALERRIVPIEVVRGALTLLVVDPLDDEAFDRAREACGADRVVLLLASEPEVRALTARLLPAASGPTAPAPGVELPELFPSDPVLEQGNDDAAPTGPASRLLMVVEGAAHRNFLPPVFAKENCELVVASTVDDVREALAGAPFDQVLVSRALWESVGEWLRSGQIRAPEAEIIMFPSVSGALRENPAPYDVIVRGLRAAAVALAEARVDHSSSSPPYGLMADDLEALGRRYGLRRLAMDGVYLGLHLLLPAQGAEEAGAGPFSDLPTSLEHASALRFPFPVETLLGVCHALFRGRVKPDAPGKWGEELHLAAQMLALVWYRHTIVAAAEVAPGAATGAALRGEAGALAGLELIEVYLRIIADRGESATEGDQRDVLLVGGTRIDRTLAARLRRLGCRTIDATDVRDARTVVDRRAPAALVLDDDALQGDVAAFCRDLRDDDVLVFVLCDTVEAARTLALLDAGADDVFAPPHDFDVVSARISRAIRTRARAGAGGAATGSGGEFSASFEIFSFLDLVQTLSHSRKTARIEVRRGDGEQAVVFTDGGRIVHAIAGDLLGEEAVYRIISWEDDGGFVVHPETDAPAPTIHVATDAVLMEGCRRLDESRV